MRKSNKFFLIILVTSVVLLSACGHTRQDPDPSQNSNIEIPKGSLLLFNNDEGSAQLVQFFEEGNIPEEVTFLYDQMGSNPEITVTDPDTILELYNRLSLINVIGESPESITDCYHYIQFKLSDDCYICYSFEGSELWCYDHKNFSIENSNKLFTYMSDLTQEYCGSEE